MKRTMKDIKSSKLKPHAAEKPSAPLPAVSDEHVAYLRRLKRHNRFIIAMQLAILVVFIGLWQLFGDLGIVNTFIVSAPLRVLKTLARLNASGELFVHIGVTMLETIAGFTVGTLVGTLIAVLMWWSKTLSRILTGRTGKHRKRSAYPVRILISSGRLPQDIIRILGMRPHS